MSESPPRILLVDDEDIVTTSIKSFLNLETDYEVVVFNSPRRALDYLGKAPVDLVVSDFLMPEMDGIQFLLEVKKLYPQTVRILLTGYADKESAIRAQWAFVWLLAAALVLMMSRVVPDFTIALVLVTG